LNVNRGGLAVKLLCLRDSDLRRLPKVACHPSEARNLLLGF
jgi:hypothetical protein